jgi:hypothetical protein
MLEVRITDEPASVARVLATIVEHIHELPCGPGLGENLERIIQDASYRFVMAADGHRGPLAAAGVVTFFLQPMIDQHLLAVEALWFRDDQLSTQLPVWRSLVELSQRMEFGGACVSPRSTNAASALRELIERGALDGYPVTVSRVPLQKQGNPSPLHSAFSEDAITGSAFISVPVALIHTRKAEVDLSGREYAGSAPLYRGEGRLACPPHWDCADLDALAALHFAKGFYARPRALPSGSAAPFGGTIAEQLLHQGYVGQGAVSLSTSFDVAANYATHARQRDEALVFTIDTKRLRGRTKIFDATATLAVACPWIPGEAWTPLRRLVGALWADLPAAGHFLERCYEEAFERARVGAGSLAPPPDPFSYLSGQALAAVEAAGVSGEELARVHDAFEKFAEFAQQRIGGVDDLHMDSHGGYTVESYRVGPMAYFEVFARILDDLRAARPNAEPGWDTTPMGYIAKAARDDECFAAGSVPGGLIIEAQVVDRAGRPAAGSRRP